jgi:pSer/pThr/pTyr-binding forkhead associated (FHA) protein
MNNQTGNSRGLTRVRLRYREQDLLLAPGQYVLGRSSACHIVIDKGLVSRRHAMFEVTPSGARIKDLGSVNGVLVNGTRIDDKPYSLQHGDRITIGDEPLELKLDEIKADGRDSERERDTKPTLDGEPVRTVPPRPLPQTLNEADIASASTQRVDPLELVSMVANKALAAGRVREAENMLRLHLTAVLNDVKAKRQQSPESQATAATLALKLARATSDGRWFDYVLDLLLCSPALPPEALLADLEQTLAKLPLADVTRLERFAQAIRTLPASFEKLRAIPRIEALVQVAVVKRR